MPYLNFKMPKGSTFEWLIARPVAILVIVIIALLLRWVIHRFIDRLVSRASTGNVPSVLANSKAAVKLKDLRPGANARRGQRANTMGSLLKSITNVIILIIVLLIILDTIGYNIAPLLASAGILGLAFGFGAQSLVKDFLAGIFMILEDQYGVGDVVDLGEAIGTVETVGLRVTRLRDVSGTVWYVRNGEILRVGNMSQNWARTVLDVTVSYKSDVDHVQTILLEEATSMFEEEEFHRIIIETPEVWGVQNFGKDGVVVRLVLKTIPLQQWAVGREMRRRIKDRFDTEGIHIPTSFVMSESQ